VNYVAEGLGLTGNGRASAMASTNKHLMRLAFERRGLPSCRSILVEEGADLAALPLAYPVIVKPTDRSGSRGIRKVGEVSGLPAAIAFAREPSFEKKVLVEEFAEGREYSIEYLSWQGGHHFLAATEKFTTGAPLFVETGHLQPPRHMEPETLAAIKALVPQVLDSLGVRFGASHTELKVDDDGSIRIIECGARMGGDCIGSDLVKLSTGVDFVQGVIDTACGVKPSFEPTGEKRVAAVRFIFSEDDLAALETIKRENPENVYRVSEILPIDGHEIRDSSTRYGYYILTADTQDEMQALLRKSGLAADLLE
jgi:biotin carboxylase